MLLNARWIDVGLVSPEVFHATYIGLAEIQSKDASPILLWGRTTSHICLGQHQYSVAELKQPLEVPVLQRPLGGGTVWVDECQYCFVLIVPLDHAHGRPQQWFEWGLAPALATYRQFGLDVMRQEQDVWLGGRKIGGSGAATIGNCAVIASSFLLHFPVERFAQCIACPSEGFRDWLKVALLEGMTDWQSHRSVPQEAILAQVFRENVETSIGWLLADDDLTSDEMAAREAAICEVLSPENATGKRLVPNGIKLNARTFLTERQDGRNWARVLTVNGKFSRIRLSKALPQSGLVQLISSSPECGALQTVLAGMMLQSEAGYWAELIMNTAYFQN